MADIEVTHAGKAEDAPLILKPQPLRIPPEETQDDPPPPGVTAVDLDKLPSAFLAYPEGAHVYYTGFTFREINNFNESKLGVTDAMRFVMKGVYTRNMPKDDLTFGDFLYVQFLRRMSALGTNSFTVTIMPRALQGESVSKTFEFEDIAFEMLDVPELPVVIEVNGQDMHFKPLTMGQWFKLFDDKKGEEDEDDWFPDRLSLLAAQCVNMEYADALANVEGAKGIEIVLLEQVETLLDHSMKKIKVDYEVDGETKHEEVGIDNPISFVLPFRDEQAATGRDAIRFGV